MRTRVLAIAAVAASGLLLAGCKTTSTVSTTAANTGGAKASAAAAPATTAAASKPAGLGDAIDLTDASGDKIAVTVVKIDSKAEATDGFSTPPAGDAYYAAQIQIKNVGSSAYSDSPSNCLVVKDGKGQAFQPDLVQSASSGPLMATTVNLAAGDTALGWVVFDVATGDTVTNVEFTVDSGMGSDSGEWSIG
jgi:hypothetical protein